MKKQLTTGDLYPTATIAINKSRVKIYNKEATMPTYYLKKGEEFQIELFNPTSNTIMAKIKLNNNLISQAGLVLKPGQRVFLDRYFDVDKKFKFDTYMVSGSDEVKKAIENNGDIEILFYKETQKLNLTFLDNIRPNQLGGPWGGGTGSPYYGDLNTYNCSEGDILGKSSISNTSFCSTNVGATMDWMDNSNDNEKSNESVENVLRSKRFNKFDKRERRPRRLKSKSSKVETGRIEEGSKSEQKFDSVNLDFNYSPFHTVSYKLLPLSQKNVEAKDLHKNYCTNCGAKVKGKDKFCSKCGNKL